jgi:hypothetical protein
MENSEIDLRRSFLTFFWLTVILLGMFTPSLVFAGSSTTTKKDYSQFTARRDLCNHFRGEEAYDAARAREIAAGVKRYCTGTDRELRQLRKKYARNPNVLEQLKRYEDSVE